jgi:hypothetical protein
VKSGEGSEEFNECQQLLESLKTAEDDAKLGKKAKKNSMWALY